MRKAILILTILVIGLSANAQKLKESDLPQAVKDAFKNGYSGAKEIKWEKENGNYEVEFEIGETEQSVVMDATGKVLETELEIKPEELPTAAQEYISKNYHRKKIKDASKITDAAGIVTYEADIDDKDLIFDSKGAFIKEEAEKKDDKDE